MKQSADLKIETERLVLRTPIIDDAAFIQREFAHWEIIKNLTTRAPWPYPDDGAFTFLKDVLLPNVSGGKSCSFIIENKTTGQPMGLIDYEADEDIPYRVIRGFWLGIPFHGNGYMTEAVNAGNKWVFENTEVREIYTSNILSNKQSSRIKEKQGFEFLGVFEMKQAHHGDDTQEERWILTKERWQEMQNDT